MRFNLPQQLLCSAKRLVEWCLRAEIRTGLGHHKQTTEKKRGRIVNRPQPGSVAEGLTDVFFEGILLIYVNTIQGAQMVNYT